MDAEAGATISLLKELWLPLFFVVVGIGVYWWQKHADRIKELKKEKCDAFALFMRDHLDVLINHHVMGTHEQQAAAILKGKGALNVLYLRCKSANVQKFQALANAARHLSNLLDKERAGLEFEDGEDLEQSQVDYQAALHTAVNAARSEFGYANDAIPQDVFEALVLPPDPASDTDKASQNTSSR